MADTAIYALTAQGAALGRRLAGALGGELFTPERLAGRVDARAFGSLADLVSETFGRFRRHVFITACGVAVRVLAPHLRGKDKDPAVVALDAGGEFVVSLLSGHVGGANDLARTVAGLTGGRAVITTATDTAGAPAVDVMAVDAGMAVDNKAAVKHVNAALAEGRRVQIFDPCGLLNPDAPGQARFFEWTASPEMMDANRPQVRVDWREGPIPEKAVVLRPRVLAAGVGCRRGTEAREIVALLRGVFAQRGLALSSLACLASIDVKRDEPGLLEAARELDAPLRFFTKSELGAVAVPNPSETVRKRMGVDGVCEAAAMLAAGTTRLLAAKHKSKRATAAVALAAPAG